MVYEDDLRDSEAVEKVIEKDSSGMIIGEILCLFLLRKLTTLLAPLSFYPLQGRVTCTLRKLVKARRQIWDCPPRQ